MTSALDHILRLEGDIGVKAATSVAAALRLALEEHAHVLVETEAVTLADLTSVQTLLSAKRMADQNGITLRMAQPLSSPFVDALESLGLLSADQSDLSFWPLNPEQK
jgi:ABC-type transporter Mla MlaB component